MQSYRKTVLFLLGIIALVVFYVIAVLPSQNEKATQASGYSSSFNSSVGNSSIAGESNVQTSTSISSGSGGTTNLQIDESIPDSFDNLWKID